MPLPFCTSFLLKYQLSSYSVVISLSFLSKYTHFHKCILFKSERKGRQEQESQKKVNFLYVI